MSLEPCPSSPNCVSTLAEPSDRTHHIEPLSINHDADEVLDAVAAVIVDAGGEVGKRSANTLEAVFTSRLFRFKDDVAVFVDTEERRLHGRSASRVGYSDLGVNRKRLAQLFGEVDARLNVGGS